jgi:hypothetical protein
MHFLISILLSTAFAATDDVKPIEPIEPIERNLIYPLMVEARAGAKANYWNPESIPGTKIATQGYATAYAEARVSLFEYLALERLRFESTVGTTGLDRGFTAVDATDDKVKAQMFDAMAAVYVPPFLKKLLGNRANTDELWGPGVRIQRDVYNGQLIQTKDKIVAHDSFDEDREESEMMSPAGSSHRFVTEFQQETYGIIARKTETNGFGHVMVGLGHLKFKKPWSPSFVENEYIFFSTMEAYGMAMSGDFHTQNDKFFNKYFKVDFLFGLGDIQLTETQNLADILDDDYGLGCVAGGVTAGIERDWIDIDGIDLYTTIFAGAWGDHFYIYNEDDSDDKTIPLTSDLRVSLGGEVRAMF